MNSPPSWWPHTEPWPPPSGRYYRDRRRAQWRRRSGWYSFWPLWIAFWLISGGVRWWQSSGDFPASRAAVVLLVCAAVAGGVALVVRRLSGPLADIVSAADRIAKRDYRVRVDEPSFGPAWLGDTARAFNAMAKELESQDEARRHLTADIAHELRTPLAVVQGKIEGIIDGVYAHDNERLQELLDETRVLARLVEDLRTLSSAESGAMALSKEPTDVFALANDAVSSLAERARDAGVAVRADAGAADLEPIAIDPVRIREVLTNLIANAIRYTPRGGEVAVTLGARRDGPNGPDGIEIRVTDTGEGISQEELPRIFDRFYKGAGSSGSGLGLTIARRLVEAHGGTIRAESRRGTGTTVVVFLPR